MNEHDARPAQQAELCCWHKDASQRDQGEKRAQELGIYNSQWAQYGPPWPPEHPPLCKHCDDPSYCQVRPADDRWCKDGCAGEMLFADVYRALRIVVWVVAGLAGVAAGWMIFG